MRLGPGLLYEGRTLQGARPKLADFCSATMAEFYSAVDSQCSVAETTALKRSECRNQRAEETGLPFNPTFSRSPVRALSKTSQRRNMGP